MPHFVFPKCKLLVNFACDKNTFTLFHNYSRIEFKVKKKITSILLRINGFHKPNTFNHNTL